MALQNAIFASVNNEEIGSLVTLNLLLNFFISKLHAGCGLNIIFTFEKIKSDKPLNNLIW